MQAKQRNAQRGVLAAPAPERPRGGDPSGTARLQGGVRTAPGRPRLSPAGGGRGPRTGRRRGRGRARRSARRRRGSAGASRAATGGAGGRTRRPTHSGKATRKWRESVKPGSTTGTTTAPGSCSATHAEIASISGELDRRAVADDLLGELELKGAVGGPEHLLDPCAAPPPRPAPGARGSPPSARPGWGSR